jgi:aspartyl-tRNA(Asn)/glutamyl-tRNA(Gln) amidotransferase subunit C
MKISREDVLRVAELAHLELSAEEVETFRGQLDEILTYIEKLNELDTANVEPMAQVLSAEASAGNPALREDKEIACNVAKDVLAGAPDPSPPYFRVPKVVGR